MANPTAMTLKFLRKFRRGYSEIAVVAACWGILLTSVAFVTIVVSPGDFESFPDRKQHVTLRIFCLAAILALGCIQTVFSILLALAPTNRRLAYDTVWVYAHVLVAVFLAVFLLLNAYYHGRFISENKSPEVTPLDITAIFDLVFILILLVTLWFDAEERRKLNIATIPTNTTGGTVPRPQNPYFVSYMNQSMDNGLINLSFEADTPDTYGRSGVGPGGTDQIATVSATVENIYAEPYEIVPIQTRNQYVIRHSVH